MNQQVVKIKKYYSSYKLAEVNRKIFMLSFLSNMAYLPITLIITYFVWNSLFKYLGVEKIGEYTLKSLFIYFFIVKLVMYTLSLSKQQSYKIWNDINTGELSKFRSRPINYIIFNYFYFLGYFKYSILIALTIILVSSKIVNLFEVSYFGTLLILLSTVVSGTIIFCIYSVIGITTFWTGAIFGLRDLISNIWLILSGAFIPLSLLPEKVKFISKALPFEGMTKLPLEVILEGENSNIVLKILLNQFIWCCLLLIILRFVWMRGIKRYEAQGG